MEMGMPMEFPIQPGMLMELPIEPGMFEAAPAGLVPDMVAGTVFRKVFDD